MRVTLVYLLPGSRRIGAATYTAHLVWALQACGVVADLCLLAKRPRSELADFAFGIQCRYATVQELCALARVGQNVLVVCPHFQTSAVESLELAKAGASFAFHGTATKKRGGLDVLKVLAALCTPVVAVRNTIAQSLHAYGVNAVYLPHPYVRVKVPSVARTLWASVITRLDFSKHPEVVLAANAQLPADRRIALFGEPSRPYEYHVLRSKWPDWRRQWRGSFEPGQGVCVAATSHYVVDLSYWRDDGGGTQYTFFEGWDAGATVVVHKKWLDVPGARQVADGYNVVAVGGAGELAALMLEPVRVLPGVAETLARHEPAVVVPLFVQALGWK